jgi:hypothetical protein
VAAVAWSPDARRCSHSNIFFGIVVKPMVLTTFFLPNLPNAMKTNAFSSLLLSWDCSPGIALLGLLSQDCSAGIALLG